MRSLRYGMVLLAAGLAACGDRDGGDGWTQRDSAGVRIVESIEPALVAAWWLGEPPVDVFGELGAPQTLAADPISVFADARGRIFVVDGEAGRNAVLAYDETGRFLRNIGGTGEGPGRIGRLEWATLYRGDSVVAFDRVGARLAFFGPEGTFAREVPIPAERRAGPARVPGYAPGPIGVLPNGSFLTYAGGALDSPGPMQSGPAWYRHELMRSSPDGARSDSLGEFPIFEVYWDGGAPRNYPYGGTVIKVAFSDGFLVATGPEMALAGYDATGALRRIFRRTYESQPISHDDIDAYAEWSSARLRASQDVTDEAIESFQTFVLGLLTPEFKPAVSSLLVDDLGNVWAEEFRWVDPRSVPSEPVPTLWSVFSPNGRWLTQVRVPAGFLLSAVSGERVYGVLLGASGSKTVRSYTLNKPQ